MPRNPVIAVDFDGTCTTHDFPRIGKDIGAAKVLKELVSAGCNLILFTMRSDNSKSKTSNESYSETLVQAIDWFQVNDIPLYGVQTNPTQVKWTSSPKVYADTYIDDAALGCPLKFNAELSDRPFVDWAKVRELLVDRGLLKPDCADYH